MRFIVALLVLGLLAPVFALTNINSCTNISYSDEFVLTSDLVGNNTYPPWSMTSCLYIYNSDVTIDCAGHSITGNDSGASYGIWINPYLKNITIKNCNGISNYSSSGIHFYTDINDSLITNNTFFNIGTGIFLNPECHHNVISNNYIYNSSLGIQLGYPTDADNLIANNTAFNNTNHGFSFSGSNNTYINNSAIQNGYSGFFLTSANSTYINNTANNNSFAGIYPIGSGCVNNTLSGSIASFNGVGVYFSDGAANNTFSNSTLSNNSQGIEIVSGSNGNRFIDTRVYGSTSYGVSFNHTTFNNNLTNTFIYGQTDYVNQQATSPGPNNFFNLTLGYNSTIGLVNYPFLNVTDLALDTNFFLLQPDWVSLDDATYPQANVSATVTLNTSDCSYVVLRKSGFPTSFGDIFANGIEYPTSLSCAGGVATFSVSSFSGYALGPAPSTININSCSDLTIPNKVYNLTQDIGCSGSCSCININASNVTLQCNGFLINGSGVAFPYNYGINLTSVSNVTVKDCRISNFAYGIAAIVSNLSSFANNTLTWNSIGIYLLGDSDNNTILDNSITGMGDGEGIVTNGTSNFNFISGNSVANARYGIRIEAPGNNLTNNNLSNNVHALLVTGSSGLPCRNYVDSSNVAGDSGDPIYFVYDKSGIIVENNASYGEVLLCNVSDSVIRNITMDDDDGIVLSSSSNNNRIYNNSIAGAYFGSFIFFSDNNSIFDNAFSSNTYGVEAFYGSEYNAICNNSFTSNSVGFEIFGSSYNTVCNSLIYSSFAAGGGLIQYASNNTVQNITVPQAMYGIGLTYYVYDNNITDLWVNVTVPSGFGGIVDLGASSSSGNTIRNAAIYSAGLMAVNDSDGGETFINTYLYSTSNNFVEPSSAPSSFANLTLARYGSTVNFPSTFPMANGSGPSNTNISSDFVSIDSSLVPELNRSANITTYTDACPAIIYSLAGFPSSRSSIISGGSICLSCNIISCAGNTIQFDVPEFTGYAAAAPSGCVNLSDPFTWGSRVVNDSGDLYLNQNATLCRDHYYLPSTTYMLTMNSSNIYLDCNQSTLDAVSPGFGIAIFSTSKENLTIENCTILSYGDGVYLDRTNSSRVAFNTIIGTGRGIGFFYDSNWNHAFGNTILNSASYGMEVGSSSQNLLHNNTVDVAAAQAVIITYADGTRFLDNNVSNSSWECLWLADLSYAEVSGNNLLNCGRWGNLLVARVNDSNFTNNVLGGNSGSLGLVYMEASDRNLFVGNEFSDGPAGIYMANSQSGTFRNNLVHDTAGAAFYLQYCNYSNFDNNTAYMNYLGFSIYYSHNGAFSNTTVYGSDQNGLYFWESSGNAFTDTVAHSNGNNAISLQSNSINLFANTLIYNQSGYLYIVANSPTNFTNLTLGYNATVGLVNYPSMNTTSSTMPYEGANIYLQPDWVSMNPADSDIGQAVSPAYITINHSSCGLIGVLQQTGFPTNRPDILLYGTHYPATVTCNGDLATFYVSGFSGYTLGQEQTYLTFSINDTSPMAYGTPINISCGASNSEVLLTIYANTTILAQSTSHAEFTGLLAAGFYNISCNATGTENYSSAQESALFQVQKADPSSSVTFDADPGWTIRPGQEVNVSCFTTNPEITLELWIDGGLIGTGSYIEDVWTPATTGSYEYTCNSTETENYTAYLQTEPLNVRSPSEGGRGREETALLIVAPDEVPAGTEILITVTRDDGAELSGVKVEIWWGGALLSTQYTDTWGRAFFTPTETGEYTIKASRTGFVDAEDEFEVLPPVECATNDDCLESEICTDGLCAPIPPGDCGHYSNHEWIDYACCEDSGCPEGQVCRGHQCISEEEPEERCASDSDCAPGYACTAGACILIPPPECRTGMDCLPGYECREGSCIKKEVPPEIPGGEEVPSEEVAGEGRAGFMESIAGIAAASWWLVLLMLAAILIWFFFWKRRKKEEPPGAGAP